MRKFSANDPRSSWDIKPRICLDLQTPTEALIRAARDAVERHPGAHQLLTESVILLSQALDKLGEYIDDVEP